MKKTNAILILFTVCAVIICGCYSTDKQSKSEAKTICILQDDFESEPSPFMQLLDKGIKLKTVTGEEALSGEKSLCIDSMKSSQEWILAAQLSTNINLIPNKGYVVEFKYRVTDAANQSAQNFFSIAGGKKKFYTRTTFASAPGQEGTAKVTFVLPDGADDAAIRFSSRGACRILIDDLKVQQLKKEVQSWLFEPDAFVGMRKIPTNPNMLDLLNPAFSLSREEFFPIVDEFGQFRHTEWEGKVHSVEDLKASIDTERKYNASRPDIPNRDEFGGLAGSANGAPKTKGFTTDKVNGKWYLRDPDGNLFWSVGITGVGNLPITIVTDREEYFTDIDPKYLKDTTGFKPGTFYYKKKVKAYQIAKKNIELKYGKDAVKNYWKVASPRLKKWGMNTCGAWSMSSVTSSAKVPYTAMISSTGKKPLETKRKMFVLWGGIPDYFTPEFETSTIKRAKGYAKTLNSKYCIGAFVDNEISWQRTAGDTALAVLSCPPTQPAKIEIRKMLRKKYTDIATLNKAWKSSYASWEDFLNKTDFEPKLEDAKSDLFEFERLFCERYFKVCRKAVKAASPKALYLGCRLASRNEIVERASFEVCDVVSYNIYRTTAASFAPPSNSKNKPVIIGEFHIARTDKGSPYGGLLEAPNAKLAGEAYKAYMISAIRNPHIVGAHWFEYFDCMVTGRGDGANATCGFVSSVDVPDYTMTDACREVSSKLYKIRKGK